MSDINLYQIANDLNNMLCIIHNKSIGAVVEGDTIFFKNPCCNAFEQQMNIEYEMRLGNQSLGNRD